MLHEFMFVLSYSFSLVLYIRVHRLQGIHDTMKTYVAYVAFYIFIVFLREGFITFYDPKMLETIGLNKFLAFALNK